MISRYDATLNGISLASISGDILVLDINPTPAVFGDERIQTAKRYGSRMVRRNYESASVSISFEIHAYDIRKRQEICNAVVKWAKNGGVLESNDRQGQFLRCVCSQYPAIESARNWIDPVTVAFTAYEIPFWQEKDTVSVKLTGTSKTGSLYIPGNVDGTLVEATIKANASLSSVTLGVNSRTLTLSGLSISSGGIINITYDEHGIQSIKNGNTSLLSKRTGVDDLIGNCGESNSLSLTASASVDATFIGRGLWL